MSAQAALETTPTLPLEMAADRHKVASSEETTGQRVRRFRLAQGLTQVELGNRVGLSQRMVAYYEAQGGVPSADLLRKLADALRLSTDVLLGRAASARGPRGVTINPRLLRRLKRIEELPEHDRKTVLKMIEALAERSDRKRTRTA
jgi:transcriptional regulator with XRE-family HTH domain